MTGLRVATYNIHACVGTDGHYDPNRILHVLREIAADVVALQEVGSYLIKGGHLEQPRYFSEQLGMTAVNALQPRRQRARFGNSLLIKGEVIATECIDLSVYRFEPRNAIDCVAQTAAGRLRIIATHLGLLSPERRRQIAKIKARLAAPSDLATLIMGDFNIFGIERRILHTLGAPKPLPKLRSFPSRRPLLSLDRLWMLPNGRLTDLHVHRSSSSRVASDHLPLVGTISLE